ncbi:MAG: 1,4-dihydroxy-6-naphthoate synthase [Desulfovibrio sp.]|nr:1,4-dihydroxy-6-naphthoate synthase [Desulfovibrio sp.]
MSLPSYSLAISPCPNDTYIFEALLHGRSPASFEPQPYMADVEALNEAAREGRFVITKLSLAAAAHVLDKYVLLNAGAALGRNCGPLVVSRGALTAEECRSARIALPGRMTTANLLLSLTGLFAGPRDDMIFHQVMPAVEEGRAALGVIIHEGRFTYAERGLSLVLDLGQWWEETVRMPLPLGVIAVRRDIGAKAVLQVEEAVRRSLLYARAHPEAGRAFIRAHAREMDEGVMASHIATFVNDFSLELGEEGRQAVKVLLRAAAKESGRRLPPLPVFAGKKSRQGDILA